VSRLAERLTRLRRESGAVEEPKPTAPGAPSQALRQRLERLRGRRREPARAPLGEAALASRLGARPLAPGVLLVERATALPPHVSEAALAEALAFFGASPPGALFLDTETTGLAGGTGTVAFVLGLARAEGRALHLTQYFLTGFHGEPAMLEHASERLAPAGALVTYNGRGFDLPLLAARYRLARLADPLPGAAHLDLLAPARCAFARRWQDCTLRSAERGLLGLERPDDIPGARVPLAWFEWMRRGAADELPAVLAHNRRDLLSLPALAVALERAYRAPASHGADTRAVARDRARRHGEDAAYELLRAHRHALDASGLLDLARLARRRGDWTLALGIWSALARRDHPEALERLAKHAEHVRRDPAAALEWTRRLLRLAPHHPDHHRRRARLWAKRARRAAFSTSR